MTNLNLELVFFVKVIKQTNHSYEVKKTGLLCTDANDDLSYNAERGLISAWNKVEDSVIFAVIYGIMCMKRFMTLATPGILGQGF